MGQDILKTTTKTITAQNQFTDWLRMDGNHATVTAEGTFVATVTIQRRRSPG